MGSAATLLSGLLSSSNMVRAAGTSLLVPLFDGGVLREAVTIATAEQEQVSAAYGQAAKIAFRDIETGLGHGVVLEQRVHLNLALGGGATSAVDVIHRRMRDALRCSKSLQLLLAAGFIGQAGE